MPGPRGAFERVVTWAFVGLVAAMLLYPARAAVVPEGSTRTDFTWDMFAVRRDCGVCTLDYAVEGAPVRPISWGLRAPQPVRDGGLDPDRMEAWRMFGGYGRGALLAHPTRPAVNVRATPQVARLKTADRLPVLAEGLCEGLVTTFGEALEQTHDAPGWARRDAALWRNGEAALSVGVSCACSYNDGPTVELASSRTTCAP